MAKKGKQGGTKYHKTKTPKQDTPKKFSAFGGGVGFLFPMTALCLPSPTYNMDKCSL